MKQPIEIVAVPIGAYASDQQARDAMREQGWISAAEVATQVRSARLEELNRMPCAHASPTVMLEYAKMRIAELEGGSE